MPGVYPAIVRFANADGGHRRDRWPDVRAMSFSIEVPPGVVAGATRLDFSLNSATTFPINDAHAFAVTVRVLSAEGMRAKWKALRSLTWSEFRSLLRVMRLGRRQQKGGPRKPYQQLRYWSTVPFLHGGRDAIKYSAIPENNPARPLQAGPNVLQDEIVRHVNEDAQMSEFDFALQFLEPATMTHAGKTEDPSFWVENAAVEWNETRIAVPCRRAGCGCCRSRCCRRPRPRPSRSTSPSTPRRSRGRSAASTAPAGTRNRRAAPPGSRNPSCPARGHRTDRCEDSRGGRSESPRSSSLRRWAGRSVPSREICLGPISSRIHHRRWAATA